MSRRRSLLARLAWHPFLIALCIINLAPVFFLVITSIKSPDEFIYNVTGLPWKPTLANFEHVIMKEKFPRWILNSTIVTVGSVVLSMVIAALAAFAFAQMRFRAREGMFNGITSLMMLSPTIMILPLFVLMSRLKLLNTYLAPVIIYVGLILPTALYYLTSFFRDIVPEILDSARIDGCSDLQLLLHIVLPISKPGLLTLTVVNAFYVWNELLVGLMFMQKEHMRTLMAGIAIFGYEYRQAPVVMAGLLLSVAPVGVLFLLGQRYFVEGLTGGAVKG